MAFYDGDPLAFMAHDNASRKHQTAGQIAAERAILLDNAGQRSGGRWKRDALTQDSALGLATSESGSTDLLKRIHRIR